MIKNGCVEMNDFVVLIINFQFWVEFLYVIFGVFVIGVFFIVGVSVFKLLKKKEVLFFK